MTSRDDLNQLVEQLDDEQVSELLDSARWLAADQNEPLTPEELARVREGEATLATGHSVTLEDLRRQMRGLQR